MDAAVMRWKVASVGSRGLCCTIAARPAPTHHKFFSHARPRATLGRRRQTLPLNRLFSTSNILQSEHAFPSQLENTPSSFLAPKPASTSQPQTLTEKIVQRYAVGLPKDKKVKSGDYITVSPHICFSHDNSWPIALKFMSIGASKIKNPKQMVFALDHDVSNKSEANLKKYEQIQEFAAKHGITFYPAGRGIGHQIMCEEGYAWPGTFTVGSDSHSNMYGGLGCLGTPIVRTDGASIWSTSKTWWCVPPIAKVTLRGILPPGVTGKDVIIALAGLFNNDEVLNHAIEFTGSEETMRSLPIDDRLTIANMTTEWGALSGLFPVDNVLVSWLRARATLAAMFSSDVSSSAQRFTHARIEELIQNPITADPGATYAKSLYLDLSTLSPFVAGPNSVKVATPLRDLEPQQIKLDKAYIVSCTNSRSSDLAAAARVFREAAQSNNGIIPKISPGLELYIAAASLPEQQISEEAGDWQVLLDAGATPLISGCGPCIGLGTGLLQDGEKAISATNRNFRGRMGSPNAEAYLASPEVVAASALKGHIAGPGWYQKPEGVNKVIIGEGNGDVVADRAVSIEEALEKIIAQAEGMVQAAEKEVVGTSTSSSAAEDTEPLTAILPGFPPTVSGEILFCDADNVNTDGIYPGKYTYQDSITRAQMAEVVMQNYDPSFASIARPGDILVSGFNFGCGSSREQAATAILAKDVRLVVAGSFGNIFGRNAINNALMTLEIPGLVEKLRKKYTQEGQKMLTRRTGWTLEWDVARSKVTIKEGPGGEEWSVKVGELPPNVQEIIARGGLEKWVKAEIQED